MEKTKVQVEIDKPIWDKVKKAADEKGMKIYAYVQQIFEAHLVNGK